jgi:hypothetical protein
MIPDSRRMIPNIDNIAQSNQHEKQPQHLVLQQYMILMMAIKHKRQTCVGCTRYFSSYQNHALISPDLVSHLSTQSSIFNQKVTIDCWTYWKEGDLIRLNLRITMT